MKNCYVKLRKMDIHDGSIFNVVKEEEQKNITQELPSLKKCYVKLDELGLSKYENPDDKFFLFKSTEQLVTPVNLTENSPLRPSQDNLFNSKVSTMTHLSQVEFIKVCLCVSTIPNFEGDALKLNVFKNGAEIAKTLATNDALTATIIKLINKS